MKKNTIKTKRGAASLYVVVFTTLLLSVITLSFVRIILSEASQTSNNDLSQSAYDSALAGIEDAKIAILKYHECLSQGFTANSAATEGCPKIIYDMETLIANDSCDTVATVLGRERIDGGVIVQSTKNSSASGNSADMMQAYTCVKIKEELPDYRSYLDDNNPTRIIPIRSSDFDKITGIKLSWYSNLNNRGQNLNFMSNEKKFLPLNSNKAYTPPAITLQLMQTNSIFNNKELSINNGNVGTNFARLLFYPSNKDVSNHLSSATLISTANKKNNTPQNVKCVQPDSASGKTGEFACNVTMALPKAFRVSSNPEDAKNSATAFLFVTLPYATKPTPVTDFSISLCVDNDANCSEMKDGKNIGITNFSSVQAMVDSTGRANDLYRRVEARIELVDVYFPYPQFAMQANSDHEKAIEKNFYVTDNCWSLDDDKVKACSNNKTLSPAILTNTNLVD